jgi:hypothetical protein
MVNHGQVYAQWPTVIDHKSKGENQTRYDVGNERIRHLRDYCVFLSPGPEWVDTENEQTQIFSFYAEISEEDLDYRMPSATRIEYLAVKKLACGRFQAFAYMWFPNLSEAQAYDKKKRAERKALKVKRF